jgi:hypothetical protein
MTDIGEIYFLPMLMDELARVAPGVSVSTVRNTAGTLRDEMEAGHVEIAMNLLLQLKSGFFQRRLFRQGHVLDEVKVTLKGSSAADHVVVISEATSYAKVDEPVERKGIQYNVKLTVPRFEMTRSRRPGSYRAIAAQLGDDTIRFCHAHLRRCPATCERPQGNSKKNVN